MSAKLFGLALIALQGVETGSGGWVVAHPKGGGELRFIPLVAENEDYPKNAKRQGLGGRTVLRMLISLEGQITECNIEKSSGNDDLDQRSCDLYRRKGRFQLSGRTTPLVVYAPVVWKLE
jgi:protein TonB